MRYLLILACLIATPAYAQEAFHRTISVSGEGKVEAVPDRAVLPVTVESKDRKLAAAKADNDKKTAALLAVAAQYKIPKEKIKTQGVYISPQYRWEQKTNKQIFDGYTVSRSVQITIDEMEQAEKVIASLTEAGIDQVQGIQFTFANPEALEAEARKNAVADARAKAESLVAAAGAKLGKVLSISTNGDARMPPIMPMRAMAMEAKAADSAPPPLPGLTSIEQSVSIVYEIE